MGALWVCLVVLLVGEFVWCAAKFVLFVYYGLAGFVVFWFVLLFSVLVLLLLFNSVVI